MTVASDMPTDGPDIRPAALNSTGTMFEAPSPSKTKPISDVAGHGSAVASTKPAAATRPP